MSFRRRNRDILFKRLFLLILSISVVAWIQFRTFNIQIIEVNPEHSHQLVDSLDDPIPIFKIEKKNNYKQDHKDINFPVTEGKVSNGSGSEDHTMTAAAIERKQTQKENTDEFLESVLKEYKYTEIDLRTKRMIGRDYPEDDKDVLEYLTRIVPGLGDGGLDARVPESMTAQAVEISKKEAYNRLLSDMITPNRTVPDLRDPRCKSAHYDQNLPDASVVIICYNEALSTLLRTIHSIVNRSPPNLLKEIIVVDDFSDKKELKGGLERYLATRFKPEKVRLVRLNRRAGLIRAKMIGAHLATGHVIVFFDAHCEAGHMWLEPLVKRIKEKRTAVVTPIIDYIDNENFYFGNVESDSNDRILVGGFSWSLHFTWIHTANEDTMKAGKGFPHTPIKSAAMIGGLFAIDRKYFWEIGSYDSGMDLWGGENLEISFRIWQCGGTIELLPCSRIGHMYRSFHPHIPGHGESHGLNSARAAEVWMDDYKELYYFYNNLQNSKYGDISRRLALRERLKCKSFKWYLDNIYKDKFQMGKGSSHAGQVESKAMAYCLDNMGESDFGGNYTLTVNSCHKNPIWELQIFFLSHSGQLRREFACATPTQNNTRIKMGKCEKLLAEEKWIYDGVTLKHSPTQKCMTVTLSSGKAELTLQDCVSALPSQQWIFKKTSNL